MLTIPFAKPLEVAIGEILRERQWQLAVAESCTGGLVAHRLTNVPGSSRYFRGGIVAYSNELKIGLLGVARETIWQFGAVSAACSQEMAVGIRKLTGSDVAVATTGIAGPTGDTPWKPIGIVYIGYADSDRVLSTSFVFSESRELHKQGAADAALALLWQHLQR